MKNKLIQEYQQGHCLHAHQLFGAHVIKGDHPGVSFSVWAPNATKVEIIGSFNDWNGTNYEMAKDHHGIFSLFVENLDPIYSYKYRIYNHGTYFDKIDPYAFYSELRPNNASVICDLTNYLWNDKSWMENRTKGYDEALNIYELHLGSWQKDEGGWMNYRDTADQLIPYVLEQGFTHIEILPILEHSFDGSWGYQAYGMYSATSRYGRPEDFMYLIDQCHQHHIGVIIDMVPVHFIPDDFALRNYDGTPLYEYNSSNAKSQWGSVNFDLWKEEVRSFLMSACNFWIETYHVDGIRFDAVSNMIYWQGNKERGENQGAIDFIKRCNFNLRKYHPTVMLIAEDSSDYPKVTHSTLDGGLGFDYKWDLGWMNDTLKYYELDPIYRKSHHHDITFSMAYFYSERFLLPLSHDEVVHGKKTIIDKMWGSYEQKFAQARNLHLYMMTHPGKKLNFMGNEIAMFREWDEEKPLDWFMLEYPAHDAFKRYFRDLNHIYKHHPAFYKNDLDYNHFQWIDADNTDQSIYSYYRKDDEYCYLVVLNMTPVSYEDFKVGVPYHGFYKELINSEKDIYDGCNMCNFKSVRAKKGIKHHQLYSINIRIAPFAAIILSVKTPKRKKDN